MSERKVATDALATLGTILVDEQKRDAIHLAVEPVLAGENLEPGEHITVENGVARSTPTGKGLGIVDPFLKQSVKKGERFWFVMYPGMVHSLRHVWTHPAFQDEIITRAPSAKDKAEAESALRTICSGWEGPDYDTFMELLETGSSQIDEYSSARIDGEYITMYGSDAHGEIPKEVWEHAEIVLGRKLTQRPSYFSCSC